MNHTTLIRAAVVLAVTLLGVENLVGQRFPGARELQPAGPSADHQKMVEQLQQSMNNRSGFVDMIVRRWEPSARESGKWDPNYSTDLHQALMKLQPVSLIAASEAPSYEAMMAVVARGAPSVKAPDSLGDITDDLVYTPVTPCRIADTRNAGGQMLAGTTRQFDADSTTGYAFQGGFNGSCGLPYGVVHAVAITITVINPASVGYLTAFGYSGPVPTAATMIYSANAILSTTTIDPILPGGGNDFSVFTSQTTHLAIDILGYFAAPVATAPACVTANSGVIAVPTGGWNSVDVACPIGYSMTGGGSDTGLNNIFITSIPNANGWRTWVYNVTGANQSVVTYVQCCQIPGR